MQVILLIYWPNIQVIHRNVIAIIDRRGTIQNITISRKLAESTEGLYRYLIRRVVSFDIMKPKGI
jgi:hypothetical protein